MFHIPLISIIITLVSFPLQAIPDDLRDESLALWNSEERMAPYAVAISRVIDVLNEGKHVKDTSRIVQPDPSKCRTPGGLYLQTCTDPQGREIPMHLWTPFGSVRLLMDPGPLEYNRLCPWDWPDPQKYTPFLKSMETVWKLEEVVTSLQYGCPDPMHSRSYFEIINYEQGICVHHWATHRPHYKGYRLYSISQVDDVVFHPLVERSKFGKPILFRHLNCEPGLSSFDTLYRTTGELNDTRTILDLTLFMKLVGYSLKKGGPSFGCYGKLPEADETDSGDES